MIISNQADNPYALPQPAAKLNPASVEPLSAPQTVRFVSSVDTFAAYNVYRTLNNLREQRGRRKGALILLVCIAVIMLLLLSVGFRDAVEEGPLYLLPTVFILAFLFFVARYLFTATTRKGVEARMRRHLEAMLGDGPNPYVLGEREMTIDEEGFRISWPLETSWTSWQAVEDVVIEEHYLYLVLSTISAQVIPRTAFASQSEFLGFARLAEELWKKCRSPASAETSVA